MKYNYSVIYTRRRSISISISFLNKITVHCPLGYSVEKIEKFILDKSGWIDRVLQKNDKNLSNNREILSFERIYMGGESVPLTLNAYRNGITDDGVFVRNLSYLGTLYASVFMDGLNKRVEEISRMINLVPKNIAVKSYKSRWGCCDGENNITFNYKIFMLPQRLQDYIIIHELCHIKFHNHSQKFWQLVEKFYPKYKACRKALKNYDFLTELY